MVVWKFYSQFLWDAFCVWVVPRFPLGHIGPVLVWTGIWFSGEGGVGSWVLRAVPRASVPGRQFFSCFLNTVHSTGYSKCGFVFESCLLAPPGLSGFKGLDTILRDSMRVWTLSQERVCILTLIGDEEQPICCKSDTILLSFHCKTNKNQLWSELGLETPGKVTESKACVE